MSTTFTDLSPLTARDELMRAAEEQHLAIEHSSTEIVDDPAVLAAHVLEPGDCCWLLDTSVADPLTVKPLGWGVVIKSAHNNKLEVEARIGAESIQLYARKQLRWMPMG